MSCITQGDTAILWNGQTIPSLEIEKGLRQGDPLSPYLFVLCMEYMTNCISEDVSKKKWIGIKPSPRGPAITHLFFANDMMLFCTANDKNCRSVMDILNNFCKVSGQKVNFQKSKIYFSPNVSGRTLNSLSQMCGIRPTNNLGKYLRIPLMHGKVEETF